RVLDLCDEWLSQGPKARKVYQALWAVDRHDLDEVLRRCRRLLAEPGSRRPALLFAVAKLEMGRGRFADAEQAFLGVTDLVEDPALKGEVPFLAYTAARRGGAWETALFHLRQAVQLAGPRLAPFPLAALPPERIVADDELGTTFVCRRGNGLVRVRALDPERL